MIQFTHPAYLVLLPPLVYFAWRLMRASLADLPAGRKRLALGLRVGIICLVVIAVSGPQIVRPSTRLAVTFVLDISDSVPAEKREQALDYIRRAAKSKRENDYIGVVVFGADASVELAPTTAGKIDRVYSVPSTSYTDVAQALGLAVASFPADASKRIVLLSDGNENLGKALDQAAMADSEGITIDTVPLANDLARETLVDRIIAPGEVKIGEPFELKLIATAKTDAHAEIRLLRNGMPVGLKTVTLSRGKNVLTFPQTIDKGGVYSFEALMRSDADTMLDNNRGLGTTTVRGKPKVLYVEGKPGQAEHLAKALRASDIDVEVKREIGIPVTLDELRDWDSIIFSDVQATSMTPDQMKMIEAGVRDLGVGFGMIGGDQSFGAGGYFNTPVEATLPVDMSIRKHKVVPSLSVVVIIDKSGSMGVEEGGRTKISLADEAAVNVVMLLQPIDKIGVIFCHTMPELVVPLQPATNKDAIAAQLSTVNAEGGGIYVCPSLQMAFQTIVAAGTRQKHVIMIADGGDCDEPEQAPAICAAMSKRGITVTTVAIGEGKDVPYLKQMAAQGGGNFYIARQARELPYIFTKDVMMISKTLLIEEPFRPRVDPSAQVLSGIDWNTCPPLLGYVATSPKPRAEVPMISHKDDPIYAQWQYGLGRSIAFTSDAKPKWAVRWLDWPGFGKFWAQAVRWSMRKSGRTNFQSTVDIDQAVGHVVVDAVDEAGRFVNFLKLEGRVISPGFSSARLQLEQTAPGRYEAEFPAREVGTYTVNVVESRKEGVQAQTCSVTIPYPPEYKDIQTNRRLLERLARITGGKVAPAAQDVFKPDVRRARVPTDLWWALTLLAALLFPLDVAVRRLAMELSEIRELAAKGIEAVRAARAASVTRGRAAAEKAASVGLGRLLESKKSRSKPAERPEWARPERPRGQKVDAAPSPPGKEPAGEPSQPAAESLSKEQPEPTGTTSRLLDAKRRARERHDE